ncbi:MAG: type I DNA topoisomerase [Spirochaetes bacterium]|nr:type I DNA topoisomerase [Spirochaetota bacterium]
MTDKKTLIVVESPTKAKTIKRYLGREYEVTSSMGHLIDLPKSRIAVDIKNGFEPDYITIRGRGKILKDLKRDASRSKQVYLAADSDREGEAISFHIGNAIKKDRPKLEVKRIVFNEITEDAIKEAVRHPREIDMALVDAQKARRVLDRLVGYNLSPLLWEKIKKGLSAGRVQSVALKVICEREAEIERFVPSGYWTIEAVFVKGKKTFTAKLVQLDGKKAEIKTEQAAEEIYRRVKNGPFVVIKIEEKERKRRPQPPFTTSKLQQAAGSKLKYSARKTMMVAQALYEGISLEKGPEGLITYMRTDSVRVSQQAVDETRRFIKENYPEKYLLETQNMFKNRSSSQDAHEAIRPTSVYRTPASIKEYLSRDQYRLYTLIWEQFVSSQLPPCVFRTATADIRSDGGVFRANGQKVVFDGFLKVLKSNGVEKNRVLPKLEEGETLEKKSITREVHYTEPPPRYTDATLVKFLEESGIGRPSTYAPIITTLIKRYYIERKNRQFKPTFLGKLTNNLLTKNFPELLGIDFTARMEERLDEVAEQKLPWNRILEEFYFPFIESVEEAKVRLENFKGITDEETDYICERCGKKMVKRLGRYGFFLACSGFPECRETKPVPLGSCPKPGCDGVVIARRTKRGKEFFGCSRYPDCDFMTWDKPSDRACPVCGSIMVEKKDRLACANEECGHTETISDIEKEALVSG